MKLKILDKFTMTNLEEVVATIYSKTPHLPKSAVKTVTAILPYFVLLASLGYGAVALFNIGSVIQTPTIINDFMVRIVLLVIAGVLIMSFKPLSYKAQKGWDGLWYISIFHTFFALFTFNIALLLTPLIMWYFLFEIRKEYN